MSNEYVVELEHVEKSFVLRNFFKQDEETRKRTFYKRTDVRAARDISFGIKRGEVFGLLGPNGAGKTTSVKMISGLVRPDKGIVRVDGLDVERHRQRILRKVGVVLEGTRTTIWPLTPLENLAYYGNLKNMSGAALAQRAHDLLDFIGLREKKNVQVRYLSRGQKQKLAICVALIADPQIILLDEPTTGLDVQSSRGIKDKILEMTRNQGKSVLVTTHDMHVAQELCDRIGIIDQGQLVTCKPTSELLDLFSDQVVVFRVDRAVGEALLTGVPGVISAAMEENDGAPDYVVRFAADAAIRSEAFYTTVERLRAERFEIHAVQQRQQNLESVFLQMTTSTI